LDDSEPREALVETNTPGAKNVWAPEAVWDSANGEWIMFWATTISPATTSAVAAGEKGYDHRICRHR